MCRVDVAETTQEHVLRHVTEHWEALYVRSAAHAAHVLPLQSWVEHLRPGLSAVEKN